MDRNTHRRVVSPLCLQVWPSWHEGKHKYQAFREETGERERRHIEREMLGDEVKEKKERKARKKRRKKSDRDRKEKE